LTITWGYPRANSRFWLSRVRPVVSALMLSNTIRTAPTASVNTGTLAITDPGGLGDDLRAGLKEMVALQG